MRRGKKTTIARDREYHGMEISNFRAKESKFVQYVKEYAEKLEEHKHEKV